MYLVWIGILLFIASIVKKRSKLLYLIQILYLWIVASCNTWNPDYINYLNGYEHIFDYHGIISEPIYWAFARLSVNCGLDFLGYRFLFYGVALVLLGFGIWKLSNCPNLVLGLYFFYPFAMDVIQMRSMMSNALVIIAICELQQYFEKNKSKKLIGSILLIIIAAGFHYVAMASIVIYFSLLSKKTLRRFAPGFAILGIAFLAFIILFHKQIDSLLIQNGIVDKAMGYLSVSHQIGGYLICVFFLRVAFVALCWITVHAPCVSLDSAGICLKNKNQFLFRCVALLSIYAFFELTITMEIERISRIALLSGYSLIFNSSSIVKKNYYWILCMITLLFVMAYFYIMFFRHYASSSNWFEYTFVSVFENNLLSQY